MLSVTSLKQVKEPARLPYCYTRNTSVQHFLGANKLNTGNTEVITTNPMPRLRLGAAYITPCHEGGLGGCTHGLVKHLPEG